MAFPVWYLLLHDSTTAVVREYRRVLWIPFAPCTFGLFSDGDDRIRSFVSVTIFLHPSVLSHLTLRIILFTIVPVYNQVLGCAETVQCHSYRLRETTCRRHQGTLCNVHEVFVR
jgi:hypothetical protein